MSIKPPATETNICCAPRFLDEDLTEQAPGSFNLYYSRAEFCCITMPPRIFATLSVEACGSNEPVFHRLCLFRRLHSGLSNLGCTTLLRGKSQKYCGCSLLIDTGHFLCRILYASISVTFRSIRLLIGLVSCKWVIAYLYFARPSAFRP